MSFAPYMVNGLSMAEEKRRNQKNEACVIHRVPSFESNL